MSLLISGDLRLAKTYVGTDDPDAAAYIAAVETADGQALETATRVAIHSFVKGCKADGIWPAIKASCILAGARTRLGALTPLVGTAPTSFNFVDGDYNRKTGLVGDGSTKYLRLALTLNDVKNSNASLSVNTTTAPTGGSSAWLSGTVGAIPSGNLYIGRIFGGGNDGFRVGKASASDDPVQISISQASAIGYHFGATQNLNDHLYAINGTAVGSQTALAALLEGPQAFTVFRTGEEQSGQFSNVRISFFHVGTYLSGIQGLLLRSRVTDLINAFGAAIPS